jgi:hypothetical protein
MVASAPVTKKRDLATLICGKVHGVCRCKGTGSTKLCAPMIVAADAALAFCGCVRQRETWERDPNDCYIEEHWVNNAMFAAVRLVGGFVDPACGLGRIVEAGRAAGIYAIGSDLIARGWPGQTYSADFLANDWAEEFALRHPMSGIANVVCNPPYKHAEAFMRIALAFAPRKVVMLLPAKWAQGDTRSRWLETTPLRKIWYLTPRPSMLPLAAVLADAKPRGGRVDYAWFEWDRAHVGAPTHGYLRRGGA